MLNETPEEFSNRVRRLKAIACPTSEDEPFFNEHMQVAKKNGLTWKEGLEHVIRMRNGGAD
jgi:hypothetical protein